jgi:hypothetical protein
MNPIAPTLHGTIKLHKPNTPIRPIINWKNAPAYGLAKKLSKLLQYPLKLPKVYNIRNSILLMTDLQTIDINENIRRCPFDVENMYTNIPKDIINIISNTINIDQDISKNYQCQIIQILKTILE